MWNDVTRFKGKVQVKEVRKLWKWPISKSISSAGMHAIKKTRGELWYSESPRHCLNFNRSDFWYSSSFRVTWPSNLGSSTFGKRICLLPGVDRQSPKGLIFLVSFSSIFIALPHEKLRKEQYLYSNADSVRRSIRYCVKAAEHIVIASSLKISQHTQELVLLS